MPARRTRQNAIQSILAGLAFVALGLAACGPSSLAGPTPAPGTIPVVAAENFYGDLLRQLGGGHVSVVSILSDPNVDPHLYESSLQNGIAVSRAELVVENGAGYDTWMDKLLAASPDPKRIVLVASDLSVRRLADNPHVWYSVEDMRALADAVTAALVKLDPAGRADFEAARAAFEQSLAPLDEKIAGLKARYAGTPVGLTETIFLYQSDPIGLNVVTPFDFQKAVADGNDPPASSVVTVNDQINRRAIRVLIYNAQTVTPLTTNLLEAAGKNGIPAVSVSETMPPGKTYQSWMLDQLNALQQALGG